MFRHQTSDIRHQKSDTKHQTSDTRHQTPDIRHQKSNTRLKIKLSTPDQKSLKIDGNLLLPGQLPPYRLYHLVSTAENGIFYFDFTNNLSVLNINTIKVELADYEYKEFMVGIRSCRLVQNTADRCRIFKQKIKISCLISEQNSFIIQDYNMEYHYFLVLELWDCMVRRGVSCYMLLQLKPSISTFYLQIPGPLYSR